MPVKLNSAGGGSVTMEVGSTASNFTVTIPSATGTMALTSGLPSTDFGGIGSYIVGRPANNTTYVTNNTVAGSILYAATSGSYYNASVPGWAQGIAGTTNETLVSTGTWRCVSPAGALGNNAGLGLWVRIS